MIDPKLREVGAQYPDLGSRLSKAFSLYFGHAFVLSIISLPNIVFAVGQSLNSTLSLVLFIPSLIAGEIVTAALIWAIIGIVTGSTPSPHEAWGAATDRLGALLELFGRTFLAVLLLFITVVGIPWGIRVLVRWILGTQAIMIHGCTAREAITESCRLVTGNWWRTLGHLLLLAVVLGIPGLIVQLAIGGIAGAAAGALLGLLTGPIFAIFFTLYYLRLDYEKSATMPATEPEPA